MFHLWVLIAGLDAENARIHYVFVLKFRTTYFSSSFYYSGHLICYAALQNLLIYFLRH
ncbi:hypothetical protein MNBD_ALPHA01-1170 [hydrothermal vent metagenome]|uniref:Uncharacterized protein n=1 Tax=hydrothermal vent metagenome TaxID=652676 RepID=A0A3B0SF65_9ZZZZ